MSFIRKLLHARCDGRYKRAAETIDHLTKECRAWTDQYRSYANRYGDLHARALRTLDKLGDANKEVLELRNELTLSQRELVALRHTLAEALGAKEQLQAELAEEKARFQTLMNESTDKIQHLLDHCADGECSTCGTILCPSKEPLHFHHDGCPACCAPKSDRFEEHEIVDGLRMRLRHPGRSGSSFGNERVLRFDGSWASWTKGGNEMHWWPDKPTAEQVNLLYARP